MRNVTFFGELLLLFSKIALASFDNKDLDPFINKFLFDLSLKFSEFAKCYSKLLKNKS